MPTDSPRAVVVPGGHMFPIRPANAGHSVAAPIRAASDAPREPFTVAIDFDGVLCRARWPAIGEEMPEVMAFLEWVAAQGYARVLWTCRERKSLSDALDWLAQRGYPRAWWSAVNANTPESIAAFGNDSRKCGAHIFIDDRSAGFPTDPGDPSVPHWSVIKAIIENAARNHANPDED